MCVCVQVCVCVHVRVSVFVRVCVRVRVPGGPEVRDCVRLLVCEHKGKGSISVREVCLYVGGGVRCTCVCVCLCVCVCTGGRSFGSVCVYVLLFVSRERGSISACIQREGFSSVYAHVCVCVCECMRMYIQGEGFSSVYACMCLFGYRGRDLNSVYIQREGLSSVCVCVCLCVCVQRGNF